MSSFSRNKGKRGERLLIDTLQPIVDAMYLKHSPNTKPPLLQRNTVQSDVGGTDVIGLPWLAIEIKNCETFELDKWWQQTLSQATPGATPVLFYKRANVKFRVRIGGNIPFCGKSSIGCVCDISLEDFLRYFRLSLHTRLVSNATT